MVMGLLFQFREDGTGGFKVTANNISTNQVLAASLNMHQLTCKKVKQDVMVRSLAFQFCEDQMSRLKIKTNNFLVYQVPNQTCTDGLKWDFMVMSLLVEFTKIG